MSGDWIRLKDKEETLINTVHIGIITKNEDNSDLLKKYTIIFSNITTDIEQIASYDSKIERDKDYEYIASTMCAWAVDTEF